MVLFLWMVAKEKVHPKRGQKNSYRLLFWVLQRTKQEPDRCFLEKLVNEKPDPLTGDSK